MAFVDDYPLEARVTKYSIAVAFLALGIGGFFGLIQALHRSDFLRFIDSADYYTILTAHGVLLALVFTTFFIIGLFTWAMTRDLERPLHSDRLTWGWLVVSTIGVVIVGVTILGGLFDSIPLSADVLFTFYAPLSAHPAFYIGAVLLIVGTWLSVYNFIRTWLDWKAENPGERIPLQAFMVVTTMILWLLATIPVAIEVVFFLLPFSLGLIPEVDPLLTRTLFWFFGHALVYFWLMPAYLLWYTVLPKLSGGRLFSDPLARIVFLLFLVLSIPVGIHHQYMDPGISEGFKFVAMTNTMFVILPSLITAFTVVASIEHGGRQRGGTGYLGWLRELPWGKPEFTGMILAALLFAAGGFSGFINAGMNINYLVHNTLWIPGHFHITVGAATALSFMAISYWLLPQLTSKPIRLQGLALIQVVLWFVGMVLMSNAMHRSGLASVPRRTAEPEYSGFDFMVPVGSIGELNLQIALGGILLTASLVAFFIVIIASSFSSRESDPVDEFIPPPLSGAENAPLVLDRIGFWVLIAVVLSVIAYIVPLGVMVMDGGLFYPGSEPFEMVVSFL